MFCNIRRGICIVIQVRDRKMGVRKIHFRAAYFLAVSGKKLVYYH